MNTDKASVPNYRHGHASGGVSDTYTSWKNMIQRCTNKNNPRYSDYGGRGITVDPAWLIFSNFLRDMGERPYGLTLEREDNDAGYTKENCKWADPTTQSRNQRLRKDSPLKIKGVVFQQNRFYASARFAGKLHYLYSGTDFFEACCARKSWEVKRGG